MSNLQADMRPAWRNYWLAYLIVAILLMSALGDPTEQADEKVSSLFAVSILILGIVAIKRFSWRFTIKDGKILHHYGIIARNQQSVRIEDLRSVEYSQGLIQRLLGVGSVLFYTAGSAGSEVSFHGIKDPAGWRDAVDREIDAARESAKGQGSAPS